MSISSAGLGSGLPIGDLVSQLVAAEAAPTQTRLDRREANIQTELSAIGLLRSALSDFQSQLTNLKNYDSYKNRLATSSDNSVATLSTEQTANIASYSLSVDSIAASQKIVSKNSYSDASEGSLTFTNGAGDVFSVSVTADNASIDEIALSINEASDNFGIEATIINDTAGNSRLVLTGTAVGNDSRIQTIVATGTGDIQNFAYDYGASVDGDDTNWDQTAASADASFTLEGQPMSSASNTLTGLIPNATISLVGATEGEEKITLKVATSTVSVSSMVAGFVESYNKLASLISQQTAYNSETGLAGALQGDALTRTIQTQLRSFISGQGSASGSIEALASLGITTERDGSLSLNTATLNSALESNFSDVSNFFADESTGMAVRLEEMLDSYLSSSGTFASKTDSLNLRLDRIGDQRETLALRLEKLEARYLAQFTAMDALVANLTSTGNFLTQQLSSIAKIQESQFGK